MLEEFSLDEIAEAYFSVRTPDRLEYERLLIRARDKAVFPVLHALLGQAVKQKKWTDHIAQGAKYSIFGEEDGRYIWAKATFEPEVQKAYDAIRRIGESAKVELCRALLEHGSKMSLAAALLLTKDDYLDINTENGIRMALDSVRLDQYREVVSKLLGLVLARAGDAKWREIIENDVRNYGLSLGEWIEQTTNTALIELQRSE